MESQPPKPLHIGDVIYLSIPCARSPSGFFTPALIGGLEDVLTDTSGYKDLAGSLFRLMPYVPPSVLQEHDTPQFRAYEDEVSGLYGQTLVYGQEFTLRHVLSNQLLYVDSQVASEAINTWRVSVGRALSPSSSCLMRVVPTHNSSEEGETVKAGVGVVAEFICGRMTLTLRLTEKRGEEVVLCAGAERTETSGELAEVHLELFDDEFWDEKKLKVETPVLIRHYKLGEYLSLLPNSPYELELRSDSTLSSYWIFQCESPAALLSSTESYWIRHAFLPLYLCRNGGVQEATEGPKDQKLRLAPCGQSASSLEDGAGVFINGSSSARLTVSSEKMNEYLLSKFLPYSLSARSSGKVLTEVELTDRTSDLIFELCAMQEPTRSLYREVQCVVQGYARLNTLLQTGAAEDVLQAGIGRCLLLEKDYVQPKIMDQAFSSLLVAYQYHRKVLEIVRGLAQREDLSEARILAEGLITSLGTLVKEHRQVMHTIAQELENVKKLVASGYLSAGQLYCSIIKEGQSLSENPETFCKQWCDELDLVNEENVSKQSLYVKILTSACRSASSMAEEYRKYMAEYLRGKMLVQLAKDSSILFIGCSTSSALTSMSKALLKYMSRVLVLYSAVFRFDQKKNSLISEAKLSPDLLQNLSKLSDNPGVRKACSLLRISMLIPPSGKFLEERDGNFLYEVLENKEASEVQAHPSGMGLSQQVESVGRDIWDILTSVRTAPAPNFEEVQELAVYLSQAFTLLNECPVTNLYLHVLKVAVGAIIAAFNKDEEATSLRVYKLVRWAVKSLSSTKPSEGELKSEESRHLAVMNALFQAALNLFSLITKLKIHRVVDELVVGREGLMQTLQSSDPGQFERTITAVMHRNELEAWNVCVQARQKQSAGDLMVDTEGSDPSQGLVDLEASLSAITAFEAKVNPDRVVCSTLLTSPYAQQHSDSGLLLVTLLYPFKTVQSCLESAVFVKSSVDLDMVATLREVVVRLKVNWHSKEPINQEFRSLLITVCNLLLVNHDSKEFRTTQSIMRNLQLHQALVPYLQQVSDLPAAGYRDFRALCSTFMYRFVLGSDVNKEALLKTVTSPVQFWETQQFVQFIHETMDLTNFDLGDIYNMMSRVLMDLLENREAKFSGYLLHGLLFDQSNRPMGERQNILARLILQTQSSWKGQSRKTAVTYHLLALCCLSNYSVVAQCRALISVESLVSLIKNEYDPFLLADYVAFFRRSYLQVFEGERTQVTAEQTVAILTAAWNRAFPFTLNEEKFLALSRDGKYSVLRPLTDPYKRELGYSALAQDSYLSAWNLISSGHTTATESGLLFAILDATHLFKFDPKLLRFYGFQLIYDLLSLYARLAVVREDTDVRLLEQRLGDVISLVEAVLGNPENIEITRQQSVLPKLMVSPDTLLQLRNMRKKSMLPQLASGDSGKEEDLELTVQLLTCSFKDRMKTREEQSELVQQWQVGSWSDASSKLQGLCSLLYNSQRVLFFQILNDVVRSIDASSSKSKADVFDLVLKEGAVDLTLDSILRGRSRKLQQKAMMTLNAFAADMDAGGLWKLKNQLVTTKRAFDLLMFFYNSITSLTSTIRTKAFQSYVDQLSAVTSPAHGKQLHLYFKSHSRLVTHILRFVRSTCDNLNSDWQQFYASQSSADTSIDLVTEITSFVATLGRYSALCVRNEAARTLMMEGLNALIELTCGTDNSNEALVVQEVGLFIALNSMLDQIFDYLENATTNCTNVSSDFSGIVSMLQSISQLLLALTETNSLPSSVFTKYLRLDSLLHRSVWLYEQVIKSNLYELVLGHAVDSLKDLVASAIYIRIFLVKMSKTEPCPLALLGLGSPRVPAEKEALEFYNKYTGSVEIASDTGSQTLYFPIPFKCYFLTDDTFHQLMLLPADMQHDEKLEVLLRKRMLCNDEMEHQQKLSANEMKKFVTSQWKLYGTMSILILLAINGFMIATLKGNEMMGDVPADRAWLKDYMRFMGFLQLVMGVASYICHFLEYLPQNMNAYEVGQSFSFEAFCSQEDNASLLQFEQLQLHQEVRKQRPVHSFLMQLLRFIIRPDSFYFIFYLTFSLLGLLWYVFYPILLLDAVRRFESLARLLQAVTSTWHQLSITLAFVTIILYIFSTIGFILFKQDYMDDDGVLNCDTLLNCLLSTSKVGLTQGGIGGQLEKPAPEEYWARGVFDLAFWALVIVIMLNITFGIIIDSYSGLREEYKMMLEEWYNSCFICGVKRSDVEGKGEAWEDHCLAVHPLRTYISMLIYLSEKPDNACSGLEKTVKSKIARYDTSFFPNLQEEE